MKPKTLTEQLEELTAVSHIAASRAEIALVAADRAEAASLRTEAAVKELMRATPDVEGRPGPLYFIGNEIVRIRRDVHPVTRAKVYATCIAVALFAGMCGGGLLTCVAHGHY